MKTCLVLIHLGLGDLILCNGMIREIKKQNDFVFVPVKQYNLSNFIDLFKDEKSIKPLIANSDHEANNYTNNGLFDSTIKAGIFSHNKTRKYKDFCEEFYHQANIDYSKRWNSFYYENNMDKQNQLFNDIVKNDDFVFIHQDIKRNLKINREFKNAVSAQHNFSEKSEYSLFDYLKVLKASREIHCIDSSFACFVDHIPELKEKTKYIHRYVRQHEENPVYKNNWTIINE